MKEVDIKRTQGKENTWISGKEKFSSLTRVKFEKQLRLIDKRESRVNGNRGLI